MQALWQITASISAAERKYSKPLTHLPQHCKRNKLEEELLLPLDPGPRAALQLRAAALLRLALRMLHVQQHVQHLRSLHTRSPYLIARNVA